MDSLGARGENLRDQAILTAFLDLFTLLVLLPFLFDLNIILSWLVVACSSVIALIILIFLRSLRAVYAKVIWALTAKSAPLADSIFGVKSDVEVMRERLEEVQVGTRLNARGATDNRLEIERNLPTAVRPSESVRAALAAMIAERDAYLQNWRAQIAQTLSEESRKLSDARKSPTKALLRRQLVELHADRDATVLTIAKIWEGSVLQPGEQLITLVPADAPLEIKADISGRDDGFVHVGDAVAIKFDTFPFSRYGMAVGLVRVISPDSFTAPAAADHQMGRAAGTMPTPQSSTEPFYRSRIAIDRVDIYDVPANFRIAPRCRSLPISRSARLPCSATCWAACWGWSRRGFASHEALGVA